MKNQFLALFAFLAVLGVLIAGVGCNKSAPVTKGEAKYFCPMHPTYTSDRPGDCPICGMKLVPIKTGTSTNAMVHIPGRVTINIKPDKQQLIGVSFSTVEKRELSQTVRTTGTVQHDETRLVKITPRFGGFVRKLFVNYTGQEVKKGDPLFTVYSPELFSTEREYLLAFKQAQKAKGAEDSSSAELQNTAGRLLEAARKRLSLWQISDEEIRQLEQRGEANDELIFRSPASGHVVSKTAVEGKAFMPGESLYEIADLSHLWLRAFVYEYELPMVKEGMAARVTFPNAVEQVFECKVTFISPHIDPQTRRAELRLELENPQHMIKPDMWADVELHVSLGSTLAVPDSSVIDTGTRFVAFVQKEQGHFEPREVKVGARTEEFYQVLGGLKEGEKVVARALFLIDSESQLKAAVSGMGAAGEHKH